MFFVSIVPLPSNIPLLLQMTTEKHRMSFPETVDEILDVSEDEGRLVCFGSSKTRHMQNFDSIHFQL